MIYDQVTISDALLSLVPTAEFVVVGNTYEGINWLETNQEPLPTKEEVELEMEKLHSEYERLEYQRKRVKEYPSFADQFDILYHGGYDAWKVEIDKIKNKYPKPG